MDHSHDHTMTLEQFKDLRAAALGEIEDTADRRRVRDVSYPQAVMNLRDGLPIFGWHPSVAEKDRERIMASVARLRGYRAQAIH